MPSLGLQGLGASTPVLFTIISLWF